MGGVAFAEDAKPAEVKATNATPAETAAPAAVNIELSAAHNNNIAIPRAALGKEFLLSASIIPQVMTPTSHGLAGKIVRFEVYHDGVDLYESTRGLVVSDDLPARRLLTTFPIVEQNDQQIVVDFNKGMRRVFTSDWIGSGSFDAAEMARSLEVPQSRVFEVKKDGSRLVIRQSAQARDRQSDPNREERYEIRYFISPYQPTDFVSKEHGPGEERYVRFFEINPQVEKQTGRYSTKITRFDVTQSIKFYYTANTPPEYEQAVREGILYWNRAFGKEVIKAEKAPEGVTAPDAGFNLVQWVPWDAATFAYADALIDPLTGASQHGQAYITSVFAFSSKARARELLRLMRGITDEKGNKTGLWSDTNALLSIDFLKPASLCSTDPGAFAKHYAEGLETVLGTEKVDDATVLRLSQDYLRKIVAHEVGHVLGLRHNFAASLCGTLTHKEMDDWFRQYLSNNITNAYTNKITASSLMDYTPFKSRVFLGHYIGSTKDVLPYDRAAIQWGYFNSTEPVEKKLLFATDQDTGAYGDVRTFDYGPEPVLSAYANLAEMVHNLPHSIVETFIRAKAPRDPRDRVPLSMVNLSYRHYADSFAGEFNQILLWFRSTTRSVVVEHDFDYVGDLNHKEILKANWKRLNEQVEKVGGVDRVLFSYLPVDLKIESKGEPKDVMTVDKIDAKKLSEQLAKVLESPAYTNFVGLDGKTYSFTKEEKDIILERGRKLFTEFEKEVVKRACLVLEKANRDLGVEASGSVSEDDIVAQMEKRITELARTVIMARNDEDHLRGKVDKSLVEVLDFKYEMETRLAAARMLSEGVGSFKGWSADAKGDLNKALKEEVDAALNIQNFKEFNESSLSRSLRDWYLNQQSILALLPPRKPAQK